MSKEYTIIKHKSIDELCKEVRELLKNNGELYGYPFSHEGFFCQAIFTTGFCQWGVNSILGNNKKKRWVMSCTNEMLELPLLDDPRMIYNKTCPICGRIIKY